MVLVGQAPACDFFIDRQEPVQPKLPERPHRTLDTEYQVCVEFRTDIGSPQNVSLRAKRSNLKHRTAKIAFPRNAGFHS